jgi:hypothetical protein
LIYGETRGHSELALQIYASKDTSESTNFCKRVQHLRDFRRFDMNKRDLGRRREDRILVAEEGIPHEIQERHFQQSF